MASGSLVGAFADPDSADEALERLHGEGVTEARVASPAPFPIAHHTGQPGPWRVLGWIALVGAVVGLSSAIAFEVATSREMNLVVGGKPIVSWTAFGVIMFELTMLFAGATNFLALVVLCAVARWRFPSRRGARVTSERTLVVVPSDGLSAERREAVRRCMAQASEVRP
jgi:hypothetical protein